MSDGGSFEHGSEHPMFRVLVLMGGSLALGCGGSAIIDGPADGSGGGSAVGGTSQGGAALGGGSARAGSGGGAGAADCPPAQWDCSSLGPPACSLSLPGKARPAGCVCDPKRPRSAADCGPSENLLCLSAYRDELYPEPQSWDGYLHVQCVCAPGPSPPSSETCQSECALTYPTLASVGFETVVSCTVAPAMTCDPSGNNCTTTAASVLRQDGVVCGCASITLK